MVAEIILLLYRDPIPLLPLRFRSERDSPLLAARSATSGVGWLMWLSNLLAWKLPPGKVGV
jgi:hypothetical protein